MQNLHVSELLFPCIFGRSGILSVTNLCLHSAYLHVYKIFMNFGKSFPDSILKLAQPFSINGDGIAIHSFIHSSVKII